MGDVAAGLRETARALAEDGPTSGRAWCRAWSDAVDAALAELYRDRPGGRGRVAVVAVGGYGRRELAPGSDIDLLLLVDDVSDEDAAAAVRAIVYPLWDAGLAVGHAVRDPGQAAAALDDLDTATAALDARLVAGDLELLRSLREQAVRRVRRRPSRFLDELAAADLQRRARAGDTAEVLEPDVKDGAGGLRDVQSLHWAAVSLLGEGGLDPLVAGRYLTAADRGRLARAYDRLLTVRVHLHLEAGRKVDRLTFDRHDAVARRLGWDSDNAGGDLLHELFLTGRTIDHLHRSAWALITADARSGRRLRRSVQRRLAGGFGVVDGVLRVEEERELDDPSFPTQLLEALATTGAALDRDTAARIVRWVGSRTEPLPWDDAARSRFLRTLWRGTSAINAVAELDHLGLLSALIPEWEPLRGRPQRNPYHRFSLDRHALHTAVELAELVRREPWAAERLEEVTDREGLLLGALLHDIGKAVGEPHSEHGVEPARAVAERVGATSGTQDLVARMVASHLTLPEVATRRDLADPGLIDAVADEIGDHETLAALHLLAAADGTATGPAAWSSWKATLVASLVTKVRAVLDDIHPDQLADGAATTARDAQLLAPELGVDDEVVRRHLALLPPRYAASVSPRAVVRHAGMAADPLGPAEVRPRVTPGDDPSDGIDDLDVVAIDRPGLFAKVAGVLAIHGGSVLSAHAFTREDGVAVDTVKVRRPVDSTSGERPGTWWASVEGDLVDAVAGRLALRARVARRAASLRRPASTLPAIPVRVEVASDASGHATVIEVHAEDGVGVLYRIVAALAELELDIVTAKIDTVGNEVIDVFYVRDATGAPLDDDHAAEAVLAITESLRE